MTPSALALSLALSFSGLAALALSLDRHHRAVFLAATPRRRAGLRVAGWCGLGLSLAASIGCAGWNFGPVQWLGALTGASLGVVLVLSYRPTWLRPAALAALPVAAILLPYALAG